MKRYTGQKALYEAINRSRAKAKRGRILERFLPELAKQGRVPPTDDSGLGNPKPPAPEGSPPADRTRGPAPERPFGDGAGSTEAPVESPAVRELSEPALERLCEAIAAGEGATLEGLREPESTGVPVEEAVVAPVVKHRALETADRLAPVRRIPMWWRLKPLQLNEGRIEISISYHIGLAVALAVILVILASFRLGQRFPGAKAKTPVQTNVPARAAVPDAVTTTGAGKTTPAGAQGAGSPAGGAAQPQGDNWIVLARHRNEADLEPVVAHFAKNGIALKIYELGWLRQQLSEQGLTAAGLPGGDGSLLVTSDFYVNPQSPGTEGYKMIQKIASVGATYKAPKGRDPFTPKLFSDAYGMKISRVK